MKESFKLRAIENIESAELLFERGNFNASANRAYYAAFHIAIAAIMHIGVEPKIDYRTVQSLFVDRFINKRKIVSSKFKRYISDIQDIRNDADYRNGTTKKNAKQQLKDSIEFCKTVLGVINENKF